MKHSFLSSSFALALLSGVAPAFGQAAQPAAPAQPAPAPAQPAAPAAQPAPAAAPAPAEAAPAPAPAEAAPPVEPAPEAAAAPSPVEDDGASYEESQLAAPPPATPDNETLAVALSWDLVTPVGSTHEWINDFSAQGFQVDLRFWPGGKNLGVGFAVAWHTMAQKEFETTTRGNATISGTQVHELSSTPLTGKISYRFLDLPVVRPYASFGFGGARALRRLDAGIYRYVDESWHWAMVPEVGVEIPLPDVGAFVLSTRFNYLFKAPDAPEQLYMAFAVGFAFW